MNIIWVLWCQNQIFGEVIKYYIPLYSTVLQDVMIYPCPGYLLQVANLKYGKPFGFYSAFPDIRNYFLKSEIEFPPGNHFRYREIVSWYWEISNFMTSENNFPISEIDFPILRNLLDFPILGNQLPISRIHHHLLWWNLFFFFFYIGCELMCSSQQPCEVDSPKGSPRLIITYKIHFCIGQAKTHLEGRFWFGLSFNTKRSSLANVGNEILLKGRTRRRGYPDAFMLHCTILHTPPASSVGSHHSSLNPATASNAFSCNFAKNGHKNSIQLSNLCEMCRKSHF